MKENLDCLLIHTPKFNHYLRPFNTVQFINFMPMGLLFMADLLHKHGFNVKILHLGIERLFTNGFSLKEYLLATKPKVVGISLHWHHQSFNAIELAREIRSALPEAFIVIGGMTASFFKDEILEYFTFIDGVITGDGEIPLLRLVEYIINKTGDINSIPNLIWRKDNTIIKNTFNYVTSKEVFNGFSFSNYALLQNNQFYPSLFYYHFKSIPALNDIINKSNIKASFYVPFGKGCPTNCSFCGGAYETNKIINGKGRIVLREPEKIIETIRDGIKWGFKNFHTDFDLPYNNSTIYFLSVFKKIRESKLRISFNFNSYSLPSRNFIDEFSNTFIKGSQIIISPESGSEQLRKIHKGYFYTNDELINTLEYMNKKGVVAGVYFAGGLPLETEQDIKENVALQRHLKQLKNVKQVITYPLELDPGSPMYLHPEKFNVILTRRTFLDYYRDHSQPFFNRGYYISGSSEKKMMKIQCKNYCFLNPIWGKYVCNISHSITKKHYANSLLRLMGPYSSFILKKLFK